jgi:hypothetical protein
VSLPAILLLGLWGWVVGIAAGAVAQFIVRGIYLRRLFPRFSVMAQLARGVAPVVPAAALVLVVRAVVPGDSRLLALGELVLYAVTVAAGVFAFERHLLRELIDYLRRTRPAPIARPATES